MEICLKLVSFIEITTSLVNYEQLHLLRKLFPHQVPERLGLRACTDISAIRENSDFREFLLTCRALTAASIVVAFSISEFLRLLLKNNKLVTLVCLASTV